jgi:hypothetical protein
VADDAVDVPGLLARAEGGPPAVGLSGQGGDVAEGAAMDAVEVAEELIGREQGRS